MIEEDRSGKREIGDVLTWEAGLPSSTVFHVQLDQVLRYFRSRSVSDYDSNGSSATYLTGLKDNSIPPTERATLSHHLITFLVPSTRRTITHTTTGPTADFPPPPSPSSLWQAILLHRYLCYSKLRDRQDDEKADLFLPVSGARG